MSKRTVELELATPGLDDRGQPVRVPLGVADAPDSTLPEPDLAGEHMLINLGPQHPATHGVLRLVVELDGETVVRVIPHLGYLHSGFEKLGEYRHYNQIIPLTDRTDYLSPMANNVGFALAAEKLMGIEITPRCTVLRVIACEMSRIISHMVWLGTTSIDLGAFTPFLWAFQERERIYNLQGMWAGARAGRRRPGDCGGPPHDSAPQVARHERHGSDDLPLRAGHGRREGPGGRGVRWDREPERGAGHLPRLRRHREAGALADPAAVVHQPGGAAKDGGRAPALRSDRHQCIRGHRDGRGRPMSVSARPTHDAETEQYQTVFTGKVLEKLQVLLERYPTKQGALLPALWLVQQQRGWISDRNMTEVAALLGLTPAYVKGVVTFYTMYHQHPVGQNFVQVCTTSPCNICGAEDVVRALLQATGAKELGATSPDGKWTVIEVECLGACGFATPVLINDDFIESVSPEKVPDLVKRYR